MMKIEKRYLNKLFYNVFIFESEFGIAISSEIKVIRNIKKCSLNNFKPSFHFYYPNNVRKPLVY